MTPMLRLLSECVGVALGAWLVWMLTVLALLF